jgi:hypothetical protein
VQRRSSRLRGLNRWGRRMSRGSEG